MSTSLLGAAVCLSPLLFVLLGYYLGRYGSPLVLRVQRPRDRRRPSPEPSEADSDGVDVYRAGG